ncbi:tetratricopeptide repeat protein [Myxococcota bacterium]|nr:tetratricopeptide repeat protein [Myxococcota bacterium]
MSPTVRWLGARGAAAFSGASWGLAGAAALAAAVEVFPSPVLAWQLACVAAAAAVARPRGVAAPGWVLPLGVAALPWAVLGAGRLGVAAAGISPFIEWIVLLGLALGAGAVLAPALRPSPPSPVRIAAAGVVLAAAPPLLAGVPWPLVSLLAALGMAATPAAPPAARPAVPGSPPLAGFLAGALAAAAPGLLLPLAGLALSPLASLPLEVAAASTPGLAVGLLVAMRVGRPGRGSGSPWAAAALGLFLSVALLSALPGTLLAHPASLGPPGLSWASACRIGWLALALGPVAAGAAWGTCLGARPWGRFHAAGLLAGVLVTTLPSLGVPADLALLVLAVAVALASVALRPAEARGPSGIATTLAPLVLVAVGAVSLPLPSRLTAAVSPALHASDPGSLARLEADLRGAELAGEAWGAAGPALLTRGGALGETLWHAGHATSLGPEEAAESAFLGHLPFLFREPPSRALLVGLRHPGVLEAVLTEDPASVRVVEDPALLRLLPRSGEAARALGHPAVRLAPGDPWTVGTEPGAYDVVVVDLPAPWASGGARAWTAAWMEALARGLSPGAVLAVRAPLRGVGPDLLGGLAAGLAAVHPEALLWLGPGGDEAILLARGGGGGPFEATAAAYRMKERSATARGLRASGVLEPADLLARAVVAVRELEGSRGGSAARIAFAAARDRLSGLRPTALDALPADPPPVASLFDLSRLPDEVRLPLDARLEAEDAVRPKWLDLLREVARGDTRAALRLSGELARGAAPGAALLPMTGTLISRARALLAAGQLREAETQLVLATAIDPREVEALLLLGRIALHAGDAELAATRFEEALGIRPLDLVGLLGLADARRRQDRLDDAATSLEKATAAHPSSVDAVNNLANVYRAKGLLDQAANSYRRAQALSPRDDRIMAGLAETYYYSARREDPSRPDPEALQRALDQVQRALVVRDDVAYRSLRGQILLDLGRVREAKAELMRVVLDAPEDVAAIGNLGTVFLVEGRPDQAKGQWERVLQIDPDNAAARANLDHLKAVEPLLFGGR